MPMDWRAVLVLPLCWGLGAAPGLAQSVGVATAVNQLARGTPPAAKPRTLVLGDKVIHNERIETNAVGLLQILLADGTSFTVGPNSAMSIDSFVYDPAAGTAKVAATLGKGMFRFIGGKTSKQPGGAVLTTPVGTVGIRGGIGDFDFSGRPGVPFHISMLFGDSIELSQGGRQIGRLFRSGYSIALGPDGMSSILKTPPAWTQAFQQAVAGNGGQQGGKSSKKNQVASALGGDQPPATPPGSPPAGPAPGNVAGPKLPSPFTPPADLASRTSWAEINNSALAGVTATYSGLYAMTFSAENIAGIEPYLPAPANGVFDLKYSFGAANGGGEMKFYGPSIDETPWTIAVGPNNHGAGPAGFGFHEDMSIPGTSIQQHIGLDGRFLNTDAGIGNGVAGTFGWAWSGLATTDGPGTIRADGVFGGSLVPHVP